MNEAQKAHEYARQAKAILDGAALEGRDATPEERGEVERLLAYSTKARERAEVGDLRNLDNLDTTPTDKNAQWARGISPGEVFIQSDGYKRIANPASRGQRWGTGAIELPVQTKGTLLEGAGAPGAGSGGGFLSPGPTVVPGVVQKELAGPLGVADLFGQMTTDTNTVRYAIEGTATSGAAGVAEAAAKPESTIVLSTVDEPVKKLATVCTVSDELLDDAAAAAGFVNGELTRFVNIETERQLLRGAGTNELVGIVGRSGVNTYSRGTVDSNAECLAKVLANTRGSSFVEPDVIVMNPANWLSTRLLKDTAGQYLGGGPFSGAYGNAGAAPMYGQLLWNKQVVLSDAIGAGTALVGAFGSAAAIARRGGVLVDASNSVNDNFIHNLTVFRAESRLALLCYRANAFTVVSGLS